MDGITEQPSPTPSEDETVVLVLAGQRIEAFLSDRVLALDPKTKPARDGLRAYAYSLAAHGDAKAAKDILGKIGRQG